MGREDGGRVGRGGEEDGRLGRGWEDSGRVVTSESLVG